MKQATAIAPASNDADEQIATGQPYRAIVEITGNAPFLFHRWSNEAVAEKAKAKKNSATKKTDNVESYVYRCDDGTLGIPGEYLRQSIIGAARFRQDPRSPRKSAMDLFKAGVVSLTEIASLGVKDWNYLDRRRVVVQRSAITRERPAIRAGWVIEVVLMVLTPEYISPSDLNATIAEAGRLIGIGDFRPTYGRFNVTGFVTD